MIDARASAVVIAPGPASSPHQLLAVLAAANALAVAPPPAFVIAQTVADVSPVFCFWMMEL